MFLMDQIPVKAKIDADQVLKVSLMKEVIKPTKPHRHADYHELILLNKGAGFHAIDDTSYEVTTPVAYYLRPGQTHCWNFSNIPKGFVVLFREELLQKDDMDLLYTLNSEINIAGETFIFALLEKFYEEYKFQPADYTVFKAYLHLIFAKLAQISNAGQPNQLPLNGIFHQYKRLINENYHEVKQVQKYAEMLNITPASLNETCKKAVGKTASALINERIFLEAKVLLSNTAQPVTEIAFNLQFSDSSHFVKFFKLFTNLTPGKYRELSVVKNLLH